MAQWVTSDTHDPANYRGLERIFEYENQDGDWRSSNCGVAAAATLLTHYGKFPADSYAAVGIMREIEAVLPPNIVFGYLGTTANRVEAICNRFELPLARITGENALRERLEAKVPVIVLTDLLHRQVLGVRLPTAHWMVAYGYDRDWIYLSNWGFMRWAEFRELWEGAITGALGMVFTGFVAASDAP